MSNQKPQVFFAPEGADRNDSSSWQTATLIVDGITIDQGQPIHAGSTLMNRATARPEVTFTLPPTKKEVRKLMQIVTGLHRLPGDGPIIHNGKKAR